MYRDIVIFTKSHTLLVFNENYQVVGPYRRGKDFHFI